MEASVTSALQHASIRGATRLHMLLMHTILSLRLRFIHVQATTGNMSIKILTVLQEDDGGMVWLLSKEGKMQLSDL